LDNQIVSIFAGVNGYLQNLLLISVLKFEESIHKKMNKSLLVSPLKNIMKKTIINNLLNFIVLLELFIFTTKETTGLNK
jgi:F0F1-type ATP synthase alpha subunit